MLQLKTIEMIAVLVFIGIVLASTFYAGIKVESDHRDALELAQKEKVDAQLKLEQTKADDAAASYEKDRANAVEQTKIVVQRIPKIVARAQYRNVCLDADGLQLVNAALTGKAGDPAGPPATVPRAKPPAGWFGGKRAAKPS